MQSGSPPWAGEVPAWRASLPASRPLHLARHRARLGRSLALQNSREIVTGGIQCIGAGPLVQLSPRDQVRREIRRVALSISRIGAKMVLLQIGETMVIRIRARKSGIRE